MYNLSKDARHTPGSSQAIPMLLDVGDDHPPSLNLSMEKPWRHKRDLQGPTNTAADIILETTGLSPA
jgi:hypothetical protein